MAVYHLFCIKTCLWLSVRECDILAVSIFQYSISCLALFFISACVDKTLTNFKYSIRAFKNEKLCTEVIRGKTITNKMIALFCCIGNTILLYCLRCCFVKNYISKHSILFKSRSTPKSLQVRMAVVREVSSTRNTKYFTHWCVQSNKHCDKCVKLLFHTRE